jgi:hypothetical protein
MRVIQIQRLLVGVAVVTGCDGRSSPTAVRIPPASYSVSSGSGQTSVVTDRIGDAAFNLNTGPGSTKKAPDFQDIVRSEISKVGRTFIFTSEFAGPLPAEPPGSSGSLGWYEWDWGLDTDPASFPSGLPFPPGQALGIEFFPALIADGTTYSAILVDRRPLLSGNEAVVTPVDFMISGATITLYVDASLLDDPSSFGWAAFTEIRHAHWGSEGFDIADFAPDLNLGAPFATWPQQ